MKIEVQKIKKIINKNVILDDISVEFVSGKIYGIKGKNGSGKTMFLRALCGLTRINAGKIIIDGKYLGQDMDFPERVGFLIEYPGFPGGLNAFDNLKVLASIKKCVSDEDIRDTISRVGLENDAKKKYRQYSLGMKQKLGIAAAIMEKPELILLDEPMNGLDDDAVMKFKTILQEEKERGALIIIVSHDLEELELVSDELYQMKEGRLEKK
ncbi:MAG: ATP-binding cassette domain-containing protein [Lachnospiraceae bacterium]|nr:ATP-binding cassette domain-containing protein [Lachnospiraceae bacterium]MBQ5473655.1 ATP-binding cassette domain-containing protein [Lachnospiraceae bacterium]